MKKFIILAIAALISFYSCSKDNGSTSENKKQEEIKKQQDNGNTEYKKIDQTSIEQNSKNPNTNTNTNTNQSNNSASVFPVKSIGPAGGKNESVDFSWMENGQEKKLSDYKGKVVLLNFWATWCGPCKRELPDLSSLSNDLKGKDFKLIGVSVDNQQAAVDNFLRSNQLSYTILHEPSQLVERYMNASGQNDDVIPQTYIIDKKGKVVEALIGSRSKEDFLKIINKYL
jgi:peroxiredoxin